MMRLGDKLEDGNLVLGVQPPQFGGFGAAIGGGGAGVVKRKPSSKSGVSRPSFDIDPRDRTINPRFPRTATP